MDNANGKGIAVILSSPPGRSQSVEPDAIQRAIEYGVDISLLAENLRLTPTERIEKLTCVVAFLEQVRRAGKLERRNLASKRPEFV